LEPLSVAVGDFTGSGILDLAVANVRSNTVSVLLGNGDGTFQPAVNYAVGLGPLSVAVGDFNHDGFPDLAVANADSDSVSVLLGNGDGTFQAATNYNVGSLPVSVAVGDFTGNGILDLAVANGDSNTVSVLRGNGDGTFQPMATYAVGVAPVFVAVGEFIRNGILDLAVANDGDNTVSILMGNGNGSFQSAVNYRVGSGPSSVAVDDFDQDGNLDLAVANVFSQTVSVLLGNGDGTFEPAVDYPVGVYPLSVVSGDFTRNGIADLAVANSPDNTVSVLSGNGDGTFTLSETDRIGPSPASLAVGDFNGDGALDLVVATSGNSALDVLLNQSPATNTSITSTSNPTVVGQPVTFAASVTQVVSGGPTPTGLVYFEDGGTVIATGTLNADGTASFNSDSLSAGDHAITAVFGGDPNFAGSTSPVLNLLVNQDSTDMTLALSANPALVGQPITLTATVQGAPPGLGLPTGEVLFADGTVAIGSATLEGGVATFTTTALAAGNHNLAAIYLGDSNFIGTFTPYLTEVINNPAPILTSLSPSSLLEGSPGFTLALRGNTFLPGATVSWNGTPLEVVSADDTEIQASVPSNLVSQEGTALVAVTNPAGGTSLPQTFTLGDAPLTATRVNLNVHGNLNFSGTVATFIDANIAAMAKDFTAIIIWDDGTANYGTITGPIFGPGPYTVSGTHTFAPFHNLHIVTVTILDQGGSQTSVTDNVIDPTANEAYVMRLYEDLLRRQADSAGLAYWSGLLDRGASRARVALDIEQSLEYRQDEVQALYARYLYRNADPAGLATFANLLAHGSTLEQVAADIVGSAEYYQTRGGGTNAGFLSALYHDALLRAVDLSGAIYFNAQLAAGASRRDVASAIFTSAEFRQDLVQGYYQSILGRPAGRSGLALFAEELAAGTRDEQVLADVLASEEFFAKL
jgi:hypothetical protein